MTQHQSPRVFDDEKDRWIEVRESETERDALLRARRDGAPSVPPPRRAAAPLRESTGANRPLIALRVVFGGGLALGILILVIAASKWTPGESPERMIDVIVGAATGATLVVIATVAGLLALAVAAVKHRE